MKSIKQKWLTILLLHSISPFLLYFTGYLQGVTLGITNYLLVLTGIIIFFSASIYFAYIKSGTRWLIYLMIQNVMNIFFAIWGIGSKLYMGTAFNFWDLGILFLPINILVIYYSYILRMENREINTRRLNEQN